MGNNKRIKLAIIIIMLIGNAVVSWEISSRPKDIASIANGKEVKTIEPKKIIMFEQFGSGDFTCTGLAYDSKDDCFWIADYGAMNIYDTPVPRIIEVDRNFASIVRELPLSDIVEEGANLQGIAYDLSNDSLWVATGDYVHNIGKNGNVLISIGLGKYAKYDSNGVGYDAKTNTIWLLCGSSYLLQYEREGKLIKEIPTNYRYQDQIYVDGNMIYLTIGADYTGDENFICTFSEDKRELINIYRVKESYAIEGICVVDGKIYISNDGLYHSAKIKNSFISVYDADMLLEESKILMKGTF